MDRFAIAQAFSQLESDYNVSGILQERPSNQRRRESIGCQLARMGYRNPYGWVDITCEPELDSYGYADPFEEYDGYEHVAEKHRTWGAGH